MGKRGVAVPALDRAPRRRLTSTAMLARWMVTAPDCLRMSMGMRRPGAGRLAVLNAVS